MTTKKWLLAGLLALFAAGFVLMTVWRRKREQEEEKAQLEKANQIQLEEIEKTKPTQLYASVEDVGQVREELALLQSFLYAPQKAKKKPVRKKQKKKPKFIKVPSEEEKAAWLQARELDNAEAYKQFLEGQYPTKVYWGLATRLQSLRLKEKTQNN